MAQLTNPTYTPIATQTLSGSGVLSFQSIPATYTDLVLVIDQAKSTAGTPASGFRFNNDSSGLYSTTLVEATGSSAYSDRSPNNVTAMYVPYNYVGLNTTNPTNIIVHIQNYANTNVYKTVLFRFNNAAGSAPGTVMAVGTYRSTNAINRIDIGNDSISAIAAGATATLYGINSNPAPTAYATGGSIYSDSSYFYHVFTGSGTLTPSKNLSADVLVIAGGGGGGNGGGGGGAGGLIWQSALSLTSGTAYSCLVGAGGTGGGSNATGGSGGDSYFNSMRAFGGGGGGYSSTTGIKNGVTGGSGGGGAGAGANPAGTGGGSNQTSNNGGTGYGYSGGNGYYPSPYDSGGGGGAGGNGVSANGSGTAPNGGVGLTYTTIPALDAIGSATGFGQLVSGHYYFAGGGGGSPTLGATGQGGYGGGGNAAANGSLLVGGNGTFGSGGGGGGGDSGGAGKNGGNGGSGIVIVRYAI